MELSSLSHFDVDIAIVIIFLLINLIVGFYYGKGIKNIEEYALGGRNFSTIALVSTIVATMVTGSAFMITITRTYSSGLYNLLPNLGLSFSLIITAYYLVPRMASFLGSLSIAESMGKFYGDKARLITAVCSIIASIGVTAAQYKIFGGIVSYFLNLDPALTITMSGMIVTFYSAFGGVRAVTFTDILQCIVFSIVILFVGILLWKTILNIPDFSFYPSMQSSNFDLKQILNFKTSEFWQMIALFIYFTIPPIFPSIFQRISMGKDVKQAKAAFSISALILSILILLIAGIGFLIFCINPNLSTQELIPFIIDNYTYPGFKGLVVIGIMAMAMSSADSFINIASVIFTHDLCSSLNIRTENKLKSARIFAIILGLGSILLAQSGRGLFELVLFVNAFYMPIVIPPFLLAILSLNIMPKSALSGMGAGFVVVIAWKLIGIDFDPIVPAMIVNMLVMLSTHYLLKNI